MKTLPPFIDAMLAAPPRAGDGRRLGPDAVVRHEVFVAGRLRQIGLLRPVPAIVPRLSQVNDAVRGHDQEREQVAPGVGDAELQPAEIHVALHERDMEHKAARLVLIQPCALPPDLDGDELLHDLHGGDECRRGSDRHLIVVGGDDEP